MYNHFRQSADRIAGYAITALGTLALVGMTAILATPPAEAQGRNKADWDFGSEELNQGQSKKLLRDKDSWEEDAETSTTMTTAGATDIDASSCADFFAGQDILVGEVCASIDSGGIHISYELDDGFGLHEVHAWAGTDLLHMPQAGNGNPKPGRFPASATRLGGSQSQSVTIPLSEVVTSPAEFCGSSLYVTAHAALTNGESAWAGTQPLTEKSNWGTYFSMTVDCDTGDPDQPSIVCYDIVPVATDSEGEITFNAFTDGWTLNDSNDAFYMALETGDNELKLLSTSSVISTVEKNGGSYRLSYSLAGDDTGYALSEIRAEFDDGDTVYEYPPVDGDGEPISVQTLSIDLPIDPGATFYTKGNACIASSDNPA